MQMPQRQRVIAGEREIAQRGETESTGDLIAARAGDSGLELAWINRDNDEEENDQRDRDDSDARRDAEAPQQTLMTLQGTDEAVDPSGRGRSLLAGCAGPALFLSLAHAPPRIAVQGSARIWLARLRRARRRQF